MNFSDIAARADKSALTLWAPDDHLQRKAHVNGYCIGYTTALEDILEALTERWAARNKGRRELNEPNEHWYCVPLEDIQAVCKIEFGKEFTPTRRHEKKTAYTL